jgi:hypothetical protein
MANHTSHILRIKGARFTLLVPHFDDAGDLVAPTTPDTEVSKDGAAFADCTEEVSQISGGNGNGIITITGDEMNASKVAIQAKDSGGSAKTTIIYFEPVPLPSLTTGTAQAGGATSITLAAGAPSYDLAGCIVKTTGGTGGGGGSGSLNNQARVITAYNGTTKVATVEPAWETNPDNTTTYTILTNGAPVNLSGTTVGALGAAGIQSLFATALTEAYRGTAQPGSAAQLLYEILQNLIDHAIVGTTKTAKKIDGTPAKTYTLNHATNPTSITEAS